MFKAKHQTSLDQEVTKNRFKNKVAVIVGAASGLGFATAERFANDGAFVALVDIDRVNGDKAEKYLKSEGFENARYYFADVTKKDTCEDAVKEITKDTDGVIDFLVNSAVNFCSRGDFTFVNGVLRCSLNDSAAMYLFSTLPCSISTIIENERHPFLR